MTSDPEQKVPTVDEAWSAVMGDVQGIGKSERNKQQGFNFRGVDTIVNAVGPVTRKHGVSVIPAPEDITLSTYQTSGGTTMHSAVVKMRYTVRGPAGDSFDGGAYGEAADAGDKAVSKAQSVAYRVFLLQGLMIPTDEPDPDQEVHQRAATKASQFTRVANSLDRSLRAQLRSELVAQGIPSSVQDMSEEQAAEAIEIARKLGESGGTVDEALA